MTNLYIVALTLQKIEVDGFYQTKTIQNFNYFQAAMTQEEALGVAIQAANIKYPGFDVHSKVTSITDLSETALEFVLAHRKHRLPKDVPEAT